MSIKGLPGWPKFKDEQPNVWYEEHLKDVLTLIFLYVSTADC